MANENELEEEEIEETEPPKKKFTKPKPAIVQIDNHETNERLDKLIALLTPTAPPTQTKEGKDDNPKKEPTPAPKRNGLALFRNPFDKR